MVTGKVTVQINIYKCFSFILFYLRYFTVYNALQSEFHINKTKYILFVEDGCIIIYTNKTLTNVLYDMYLWIMLKVYNSTLFTNTTVLRIDLSFLFERSYKLNNIAFDNYHYMIIITTKIFTLRSLISNILFTFSYFFFSFSNNISRNSRINLFRCDRETLHYYNDCSHEEFLKYNVIRKMMTSNTYNDNLFRVTK